MLVLSRSLGESVMIGDDLRVTVMALEPERARLQAARVVKPIATPDDVISEVWLQIDEKLPISAGISVILLKIESNKVRLGINSPASIEVTRKEFYDVLRPRVDRPD